jgi:hypothetical protein
MRKPSALRFFAGMNLHPVYGLIGVAVIAGFGVWTTATSPGELDSGLGMLLVAQMFMASTGFLGRARRGHFDPMLGAGRSRTCAVFCHWVISIAPGLAGWLCLSMSAYFQGSNAALSALVGTRAVAFFIVSAVSWAGGFMLARGAAGVAWFAVLVSLLIARVDLLAGAAPASPSWLQVLRQAVTVLVCPFLLLTTRAIASGVALATAGVIAGLLLVCVWRWPNALDIYLVDRA